MRVKSGLDHQVHEIELVGWCNSHPLDARTVQESEGVDIQPLVGGVTSGLANLLAKFESKDPDSN